MAAIAGLRGTGDWGANERPTNFRDTILWLDPNGDSPLTALLSKMRSENVDDPQFQWWEETLTSVRILLGTNGDDGTHTTFTVAAYSAPGVSDGALSLVAGDLLLVEDNTGQSEIVQVASTPSADTTMVVTRGAAGSSVIHIPDASTLLKIGSAFAEGTGAPPATSANPTMLTNYCQIFKTTYDITETARRTYARTGDLLKNERKRKMFTHSRDLEWAFMFGRPYLGTGSNGKPQRYTGGLNNFIQTNRTVFSGTTGASGWNTDNVIQLLAQVFNYNGEGSGNQRLVFCGNGFLTKLNLLVKDDTNSRINFEGSIKVYGMELTKVTVPQGSFFIRSHPLMNTHPVYTNSAFVINPRGLIYRYVRDTTFKDGIQPPDSDSLEGQWLTEAGLEVHHENTMLYFGKAGG